MARYELTLDPSYVPEWRLWEGIREIVQNALDAQDDGYKMVIEHDGEYLRVKSEGVVLPNSVLRTGSTTKADREDQRGQWGEGLTLGLLALTRAGHEVQIYNGREKWTPSFEKSRVFTNGDLEPVKSLVINTRKLPKAEHFFTVCVKLSYNGWEALRINFLDLRDEEPTATVTDFGRLLLDEDLKGCIFARGIYVTEQADLGYGYDLATIKLDRDRKMPDDWDLKWQTGQVWGQLITKAINSNSFEKKAILEYVYNAAEEGHKEVKYVGHHTTSRYNTSVSDEFAVLFRKKHGSRAVPVRTEEDGKAIRELGRKAVKVNEHLWDLLRHSFGDVGTIIRKVKEEETKPVIWEALEPFEAMHLRMAESLVKSALSSDEKSKQVEFRVSACTFTASGRETARWDEDGVPVLGVRRSLLSDFMGTLRALVNLASTYYRIKESHGLPERVGGLWALVGYQLLSDSHTVLDTLFETKRMVDEYDAAREEAEEEVE